MGTDADAVKLCRYTDESDRLCGVAAMLEALGVLQPAKAVLRFFDFLLYTGGDTTTRARYHLN